MANQEGLIKFTPDFAASADNGGGEKDKNLGRNDFEKALYVWRMPSKYEKYFTKYAFPTEDETRLGMRLKKSFILTRMFMSMLDKIDWSTPTLRDPKIALEFSGKLKHDTEGLIETIDSDVSQEDLAFAKEFKKDMLSTIGVLREFVLMFTEIKAANGKLRNQQDADRMKEIYTKAVTIGNIDRLMIFHGLPELMDDTGNLSTITLGDILFNTVQEIIYRGHDWVVDPATGWVREKQYAWTPGTPEKKGANWVISTRSSTGEKSPSVLYSPMFKGEGDKFRGGAKGESPFPENEAGSISNRKTTVLNRDVTGFASSLDVSPNKKNSGDIAAALAYQVLVIWGEADAQDIVFDQTRKRAAPVGWAQFGRGENAEVYSQKTSAEDSADSKSNPFIVGRMKRAFSAYNAWMTTRDGRTLNQAILTSKNWKEVHDLLSPVITQKASLNYIAYVARGMTEYQLAESIAQGPIFDIATMNIQEGQVKQKPEAIQKLFDRIRNALEYHEGTDLVPGGVFEDPKLVIDDKFNAPVGSKEFIERHLPSEEFYEIVIVDHNFPIDETILKNPDAFDYEHNLLKGPKQGRYITRFPSHYNTTPIRLAAWLQNPKLDEKSNDSRSYKHATAFSRPVKKYNPVTGNYELTGQKDKVILIQTRDDSAANYNNSAKELVQRLHVEYVMEMAGLPSDTIQKLKKEDWLPLGLFFSSEMRKKYLEGYYGKPSDRVKAIMGERFQEITGLDFGEFIMREDPGIVGRNLYSEKQFGELLALLGFKITAEDWLGTVDLLNTMAGMPQSNLASTAKKSH